MQKYDQIKFQSNDVTNGHMNENELLIKII